MNNYINSIVLISGDGDENFTETTYRTIAAITLAFEDDLISGDIFFNQKSIETLAFYRAERWKFGVYSDLFSDENRAKTHGKHCLIKKEIVGVFAEVETSGENCDVSGLSIETIRSLITPSAAKIPGVDIIRSTLFSSNLIRKMMIELESEGFIRKFEENSARSVKYVLNL